MKNEFAQIKWNSIQFKFFDNKLMSVTFVKQDQDKLEFDYNLLRYNLKDKYIKMPSVVALQDVFYTDGINSVALLKGTTIEGTTILTLKYCNSFLNDKERLNDL